MPLSASLSKFFIKCIVNFSSSLQISFKVTKVSFFFVYFLGKYRGAAHNACNLLLKIDPRQHVTPVVFHNLRGYDSHILIANLGKSAYKQNYVDRNGHMQTKVVGGVSVIANNMERFMSFTWNRFRFIDSAQFLSASLDRLVSATPDDAFTFSSTLDNHHLLKRKGENISR